jgi:hypothetical protein
MATVSFNDLNIAGSGKQVIEVLCLEQKLESKDPLLARVWHSIELTLFKPCILGVGIYGHVDGSVLLRFSCSGFALMLFCRCVCLSLPISVSHS